MNITITWWMIAGLFFVGPFIWVTFIHEEPRGDYSFDLLPIIVFGVSWAIAITMCAMKLAQWIWG